MTIEKAHRKDYLEIAALDRIVWLDYPNGENIADGEHTWRHWIEDAIVRIWRQDGRIAGVALAFPTIARGFCLHKCLLNNRREVRVRAVSCYSACSTILN